MSSTSCFGKSDRLIFFRNLLKTKKKFSLFFLFKRNSHYYFDWSVFFSVLFVTNRTAQVHAYLLQMSRLFKNCFSAFLMDFAKSALFCGAFNWLCALVKYTRPIVAYARCSSILLFSSTAVPNWFVYSFNVLLLVVIFNQSCPFIYHILLK